VEQSPDKATHGQQVGRSRHWASGQNEAAMRQSPVAQPLMTINGRFRYRRGTAPDPLLQYLVLESGRSRL